MKKLFLITAVFMFMVGVASVNAGPFLVCNPVNDADSYLVTLNTGEEIETQAQLNFDLGDLEPGEYVVTVKAKKGVWVSKPSVPFEFTKPLLPSPTGIGLKD